VVIEGATGSGKTVCAEVPALKAALEKRRSIFIEPQRALAHEKYCWLKKAYGPLGLTVVVSSRDHHEFDTEIARGGFDIAVVVVEKLHGLLVSQPRLLEQVASNWSTSCSSSGIRSVADREMLITKILRAKPTRDHRPRSAVQDARVTRECSARGCSWWKRPVDLAGQPVQGRTSTATTTPAPGVEEGFTTPAPTGVGPDRGGAQRPGGQAARAVISSTPTGRHGEDVMAQAPRLHWPLPPRPSAAQRLEVSHARDLQIESRPLRGGEHTADMSSEQRENVEDGFRKGEIR
jgi:hypothetical protein